MKSESASRVNPDIPTLLLVNGNARRGQDAFSSVHRALAARVRLLGAHLVTSPADMIRHIREGLQAGVRRFVVGGGDGTLSSAADVLHSTPGILGVLPLGTGNTFWHGLGLPAGLDQQLDFLAQGSVVRLDLGLAETPAGTKVFLNTLTLGVSERLVEMLTREAKSRFGYGAWVMEFHQALRRTPPFRVELTYPDLVEHFHTRQLVVVNGRTIAAGIAASPTSSAQDGLLEVFRLGGPAWGSMLAVGIRLVSGHLLTALEARYHQTSRVHIRTEPTMPLNIDGEIWQETPVSCRVLPRSLAVIAPAIDEDRPRRWPVVMRTIGPGRRLFSHAQPPRAPSLDDLSPPPA